MSDVASWVGRKVRITADEAPSSILGETGTVLAVADAAWRPAAWLRVHEEREYPAYRSVDLCWVTDFETGEAGPVWGCAGDKARMERHE